MDGPAIKGSIFVSVIQDLRRLREEGRISNEKLQERLTPSERELLESPIGPGSWYPMESYGRLTDFLCELEGGNPREYFRGRGAANARRLIDRGLYGQLEFLKRWDKSVDAGDRGNGTALFQSYLRSLKLVVTLSKSIYSTGDWRVERDPDRPGCARIDILDAGGYSEGMRFAIEGFLNECVRAVRGKVKPLYRSDRVAPDHIRIWMTNTLSDFYGMKVE